MISYFADWAAHNSANFDYLKKYEKCYTSIERDRVSEWFRPSVWTGTDQGTEGQWVRPSQELTTRGWAYNVFNITNTATTTYR